jgi:L-aminopeptidase/D-esterase-like protein
MTTTYTINQLDRNTSDGFVTTVHYNVTKVDGDYSASTYGTVHFEAGTPTTPYASLTKAQVIEWVKDKLGEEVIEASLASQIAAKKNPTTATGVPW